MTEIALKQEISSLQKIFSISAAVFYLVLSIGINLNFHYCEDVVKDIHLAINSETATEDNCHTENNNCCDEKEQAGCEDCCSYSQENLKIEEDQQISAKTLFPAIASGWYFTIEISASSFKSETVPAPSSFITIHQQPNYLRNCSFIFYG